MNRQDDGSLDDESSDASGDHTGNSSGTQASDVDEDPIVRRRRVEAVLLLAKSPLSPRKLAQLAQVSDATEARTHVRQLVSVYQDLGRAMRIELIAGGYRMMTRSALAPWLSRLSHVPAPVRLSTPMMETLAIVAYRGPLARSGVEAVRGVACGELLRQLMERDLIRIAGRSEELGRPYLYGTTKRFLQLFGLANSEALPPIQWQTLQDDNPEESSQENLSVHSISQHPLPEGSFSGEPSQDQESTSPVTNSIVSKSPVSHSPVPKSSKEPVVSTSVASEPSSEANPNIDSIDPIIAASQAASSIQDWAAEEVPAEGPAAVIEDEEDDLYEGVNDDDDDDDWDDDDWDEDDEEDEEDEDEDEDDDELDGDWEEVDDSDDDDDDDDDEELDDVDQADDDEDWDDDDDEDEDDDEEWD